MTPQDRAKDLQRTISASKNLMVPWYLMTSWLYYIWDISLLPDEDYDKLCKRLLQEFDGIEHRHKHIISTESLKAGTAFDLKHEDYPVQARCSAQMLAMQDGHIKWDKKYKMLGRVRS